MIFKYLRRLGKCIHCATYERSCKRNTCLKRNFFGRQFDAIMCEFSKCNVTFANDINFFVLFDVNFQNECVLLTIFDVGLFLLFRQISVVGSNWNVSLFVSYAAMYT